MKPKAPLLLQKLRSFLSVTLFMILVALVGLLSLNLLQALIRKLA